jgi:DNA-binding FadR family transcriptional regulator
MHRPVLEAVLVGDSEAASSAMKKHSIEFGQNLINMEKTFREKKSLRSL